MLYFRSHFLSKKFFFLVIFIFISFGILCLYAQANSESSKITHNVNAVTYFLVNPVLSISFRPFDTIRNIAYNIVPYVDLIKENQELKIENQELKTKNQNIFILKDLIHKYKKLLNAQTFLNSKYTRSIMARTLINSSRYFSKTILVDVGVSSGIQKDAAVVDDKGLIGRVISVYRNSSLSLLITDPTSRIPISINSKNKAIMIGNNSKFIPVFYIKDQSAIKNGQIVTTSGDGSIFPSGIPIGIIKIDDNRNAGGRVFVQPFSSMQNLENVCVEKRIFAFNKKTKKLL